MQNNVFIGLSKQKGILSKIIRFFGRTSVSHAFLLYFDPRLNTKVVLHSNYKGVNIQPMHNFLIKNDVIYLYKVIHKEKNIALTKISKLLGRNYDIKSLIFNGIITILTRWLKIPINLNKFIDENPSYIMCSELIAWYFKNLSIVEFENIKPEIYKPWDILNDLNRFNNKYFYKL